jgi:hypothetical protein
MNQPEQHDPIDALLREQNAYVEDAGFTARVMASVPRRRRMAWLRPALLLGAAAIGSVLAVRWLPWETLPPLDPAALLSIDPQVLLPWGVVFAVAAAVTWAAVAAFQWED